MSGKPVRTQPREVAARLARVSTERRTHFQPASRRSKSALSGTETVLRAQRAFRVDQPGLASVAIAASWLMFDQRPGWRKRSVDAVQAT